MEKRIETFKNKIKDLKKLSKECENNAKEKNDKLNYAYHMGKQWAYKEVLDLLDICELTTLDRDITQKFNFLALGIRDVAENCAKKAKECDEIKWQWWEEGKEQAYKISADAIYKTIDEINGKDM